MADFHSLNIPEELKQRLFDGTKPRELYEVSWMSYIRPEKRDITVTLPGIVTVRLWAQDARQAIALVEANMPTLNVNGEDQELPILVLQSVHPCKPGISEDSLLEITNPAFELKHIGTSEN